eukprot:710258-Pyramimonas_sp.AAC.2
MGQGGVPGKGTRGGRGARGRGQSEVATVKIGVSRGMQDRVDIQLRLAAIRSPQASAAPLVTALWPCTSPTCAGGGVVTQGQRAPEGLNFRDGNAGYAGLSAIAPLPIDKT